MVHVPTYAPIRPSSPHIGLIALGIIIVLFFQCMSALLDPVNRTKGEINWKFMAHTAAMFSFATIYIAMNLNIQSIVRATLLFSSQRAAERLLALTNPCWSLPIGCPWFTEVESKALLPYTPLKVKIWR